MLTNTYTQVVETLEMTVGGVTIKTNVSSLKVSMTPVPANHCYGQTTYNGGSGQNEIYSAEAIFVNHYVVKYAPGQVYYDPSYGKVYIDGKDFKAQSISGISRHDGRIDGKLNRTVTLPLESDTFTLPAILPSTP